MTVEQLQQGEVIVDFAFTHEDATFTPTQLGLRVPPDVILAQDPKNAHLQATAVEVDEHEVLYQEASDDCSCGHMSTWVGVACCRTRSCSNGRIR